tara:strand:- start:1504 stop:1950 length:447 start_codon:yes stop_codon:yes gene_type:complete
MAIGGMLDGLDQQYVANKDERGTWRILNTWHDDVKVLDAESEIDDNSDAVTVLTEGEFIALVKEATRNGVLDNASFTADTSEYDEMLLARDEEIAKLEDQIKSLEGSNTVLHDKTQYSEDYKLKEKAMESILKMVSMSELATLTNSKD